MSSGAKMVLMPYAELFSLQTNPPSTHGPDRRAEYTVQYLIALSHYYPSLFGCQNPLFQPTKIKSLNPCDVVN